MQPTYIIVFFTALSVGCSTTPPDTFPAPAPKTVTVTWIAREDVAKWCAKMIQMSREQAYITPPKACAMWTATTCHIYTGPSTTHEELGHEARHCFVGHFHK